MHGERPLLPVHCDARIGLLAGREGSNDVGAGRPSLRWMDGEHTQPIKSIYYVGDTFLWYASFVAGFLYHKTPATFDHSFAMVISILTPIYH